MQPYQHPIKAHSGNTIGLLRRLAALCYDTLLVFALLILATFILLPFNHGQAVAAGNHFYQAYLIGVIFSFFAGFWYWRGQTLGMLAWQIRLISADGSNPKFWQIALRFFGAVITSVIGLFWIYTNHSRCALYDSIANTRLVRYKP